MNKRDQNLNEIINKLVKFLAQPENFPNIMNLITLKEKYKNIVYMKKMKKLSIQVNFLN